MVNQLKTSFLMGGLLTVGLSPTFESLAASPQPHVPQGKVIAENSVNKPASPFNLRSHIMIVVLEGEPLISFGNHGFSGEPDAPFRTQSLKVANGEFEFSRDPKTLIHSVTNGH
jgi:hypothetical protein